MSFLKPFCFRAQTMLEYLVVMVVIAVVVFGAFTANRGGMIDKTRDVANRYFDTGAAAIMGGYYEWNQATGGERFVPVNPNPINGNWCNQTRLVNGFLARECACPRPAFGGAACEGNAVVQCPSGNCPAGTNCPTNTATVACGQSMGTDIWGAACPGTGTGCPYGYQQCVSGSCV